jgi:phosphoglycolate phosphatase
MIKLVAFDWNGTLFADTYACLDAVNQVLGNFEAKPINVTQYQQYFTVPIVGLYQGLGFDKEFILQNIPKISHIFHSYYEPRALKVRTRKGAKKILAYLANKQINCLIFSNHVTEAIEFQIRRLKIEQYFSKVLANSEQDSALKERHKEKSLQNFIKEQKLKPHQVLVVGDSQEEVEIGQKLGAITVALTGGNYTTARLKAAKPDYLINNLGELKTIIKKINDEKEF